MQQVGELAHFHTSQYLIFCAAVGCRPPPHPSLKCIAKCRNASANVSALSCGTAVIEGGENHPLPSRINKGIPSASNSAAHASALEKLYEAGWLGSASSDGNRSAQFSVRVPRGLGGEMENVEGFRM